MTIETRTCKFGDHPFEYETRTPGPAPGYCSPEHQQRAAAIRARARLDELSARICAKCREEKPASEFGSPTNPYCRPCKAVYERDRRKINGQQNPEYTRAINLKRYGLTPAEFDKRLAAQNSLCAICGTAEPGGQGWHVDHDHRCCNTRKTSCGRCTRGLLCSRCNIAIGNLRDDPVIIQAALDYVVQHRIRVDSLIDLPPDPAPATRLPPKFNRTGVKTRRRYDRQP